MDAYEAITTRRCVRKFKTEKIPSDLLNNILKAAMHAPSARNEQPWQFIVIDDKKLLDAISEKHPHASMCKTASIAILVCADLTLVHTDMWALDCAAATQNILIASHAFGLGSVWVGVYFKKEYVELFLSLFKLPDNIIPISLIPMGYPSEKQPPAERFKKERIHFNNFP